MRPLNLSLNCSILFLSTTLIMACGGSSSDDNTTDNEDDTITESDVVESNDSDIVETASCDNGSTETAEIKQIGTLSGVEGLAYESESTASVDGVKKTISGVTTASGEYEYYEVCDEGSVTDICYIKKCTTEEEEATGVEISHPDIRSGVIGQTQSTTEALTLKDIIFSTYADQEADVKKRIAVNVYQFLMTLDDDGDPSTGVRITSQIRELGQQHADKVDFTREDFDSHDQVADFMKKVINKDGITADSDAKEFLQSNLATVNRFIIAGSVIGNPQPIRLQLNGSETITPSENGRFFFHSELQPGDRYQVEPLGELASTFCEINNGSGIIEQTIPPLVEVVCQAPTTNTEAL